MPFLWLCTDVDDVTPEQLAQVQDVVPDMTVVVSREEAAIQDSLDEIEVAAGWLDPDVVLAMPRVQWVQHWAAGVDSFVTRPEIVEKDFILTSGSGIHAVPITEHIFALLLAFARGLHCAVRDQVAHRWVQPPDPCGQNVFELPGTTMVLVGVGAIGAQTAKVAAALGIRVIGVRRDPADAVQGVARMVGPDQLLDVLPEADFLVLTVPLTERTRGMIGETELRAMKPSAIIVNIGRGGTIQENALLRALQEGWIGGAGLDVFETEPLPEDSPWWDMPNVIVTAHYAGHNPYYDERALAIFLDNLRRYVTKMPLRNVVDMRAGY
ncbi:MAG: D-2-hydroxyacid dehydrogenase [Anaerolineae bacterium]|nr:D-2-hydroxyacid dehydrogenase [Anaerolineae bacterium]